MIVGYIFLEEDAKTHGHIGQIQHFRSSKFIKMLSGLEKTKGPGGCETSQSKKSLHEIHGSLFGFVILHSLEPLHQLTVY